ncbi:MAG: hypothetical protein LBG76_08405 [Treponema sp.]|jgi:hypothetical protein|nr:hypothetical protein [Treponema sp.]
MHIYKKAVLTAALLSLTVGGVNFFVILNDAERAVSPGWGGYAALSLAVDYPEEAVLRALTAAGIEPVIAESTQWVYIDDFGELTEVPLNTFPDRLEDFDPRNDGYARRLRAFFLREGKRYLYMPLSAGLERRITASLGDVPFTLELPSQPLEWYFLIFAAASAGSVALGGAALSTALILPPAAGLYLAGAPGFAMAAALLGMFGMIRAPLRELLASRRPGSLRRQWVNFRFSWFRTVLLGGLYWVVWRWSGLSVRSGLVVLLSFSCAFAASLRLELRQRYVRFQPVPIRHSGQNVSLFPRSMAPFTLASILVLFALPPFLRSQENGEVSLDPALLIRAGEYDAHVAFQSGFSYRPLRSGGVTGVTGVTGGEGRGDSYRRYARGEDGLIQTETEVPSGETGLFEGAPPFPLEDLMAFLNGVGESPPQGERFLIVAMGVFCIPVLIPHSRRRGKAGALLINNDKRVAA